ncbi:FAD-dependent oxidoreductase [Leucobacter sp. gxy201]|uniref:FAD-dependent oxidoreductase n=1 Tax=Leucobacter sp. gxy201 TaxID=2957200 RepID=UPI003DA06037
MPTEPTSSTATGTLVIGGGVIGLATAWQLARRGERVHLLERFAEHHDLGASHGSTRNMNNAYDEGFYLDLYDEALGLWRELEAETGLELLRLHGLVTHGDPALVEAARETLVTRGAEVEVCAPAAARERFGGMAFEGDVLLTRQAGIVLAARALDAFAQAARDRGAVIEHGVRVRALDVRDAGTAGASMRVEAETADGGVRVIEAERAVVAAGAWSADLLAGLVDLPELVVTEEHPAHFPPRDPEHVWPSFNHLLPSDDLDAFGGNVYGMPSPGEGVKVGFHRVGAVVDPDDRAFRASDEQRARLRDYVAEWFPGLDADRPVEMSCTYTSTTSGRFVLDTVGALTIGAGFSGHGFKFAPAIGRVLADAATGAALPPEPFRLAAHRSL